MSDDAAMIIYQDRMIVSNLITTLELNPGWEDRYEGMITVFRRYLYEFFDETGIDIVTVPTSTMGLAIFETETMLMGYPALAALLYDGEQFTMITAVLAYLSPLLRQEFFDFVTSIEFIEVVSF